MKQRLLSTLAAVVISSTAFAASDTFVYIGSYTGGKNTSKGITLFGLDSKTGTLELIGLAAEAKSPSFMAISPNKQFLYAVAELGGKDATVSSFAVDKQSGKLTFLNKQASGGSGPCHLSVDHTGKVLLVANYGSGHIASLPIKDDGSLEEAASTFLQGPASKADPERQKGPHAHSINVDKGNRFAFACDLGCDKIFSYKLDTATAKLTPNDPAFVSVSPASGPRHFAFHPSGKFAFANNEIALTETSFSYDADKGALTQIETVSTLPPGVKAISAYSTAETQVHPSGKFVYVSNRGHNTIACFRVDEATGKLTYIENAPSVVRTLRNFGIDPSGQWLIAAGQDSNNIAVFSIEEKTGKLKPTGQVLEVGAPVCVKFLKRE